MNIATAFDFSTELPIYMLVMLIGLGMGAVYWVGQARKDYRVFLVYLAAIGGGFVGAKLVYLVSEGWLHTESTEWWMHWLTGKSVTGALLGGWIGVELCKKQLGYSKTTGDQYAVMVPLGLLIGRLGCLSHGCCVGVEYELGAFSLHDAAGTARWPAVPVEIAFNFLWLGVVFGLRWSKTLPGQHFHLYLIAYGLFRFGHEFLRETPKPFGGISGYQLISLLLAAAGMVAFYVRAHQGQKTTLAFSGS